MVKASDYVAAGYQLLSHANLSPIPYVANGHTLAGMDCQGMAEYLLVQCGVPYGECNRAGSNSHIRECVWVGTPEECVEQFGSVPEGAWLFIVNADGGEPEKYRGDGVGNASHMGVYLAGSVAIHASASRGQVAESQFYGKTVPNGGWNMVGLCQWVDYGLDTAFVAHETSEGRTAYVISENGKAVHLRRDPSTTKPYLDNINVGMPVEVISTSMADGMEWAKIRVAGRTGYMQTKFLSRSLLEETPVAPPSPEQVTVTLDRQTAEKVLTALQTGLARG